MKRNLDVLQAITRQGSFTIPVGEGRLSGTVVSEDCSVFFTWGVDRVLLHSGPGRFELDLNCPEDGELLVTVPTHDDFTSVWLREWQDGGAIAGWSNEPSFAQTEVKARGTISPEVWAMMEQMKHNALRREQALRADFERRLK